METEVVSSLTSYGPGYISEDLKDLEKVVVPGGKRKKPLCKQIYGFEGDLTKVLDEGIS